MLAVDTSVVIAGLLSWHEHHAAALPWLRRSLQGPLAIPLPALIESYAVMTRLPAPWRIAPADAAALLTRSFQGRVTVPSLDEGDVWPLVPSLSERGVAGGATYDAHIVACARKCGATHLATFNHRHFVRLDLGPMLLVVPEPPPGP